MVLDVFVSELGAMQHHRAVLLPEAGWHRQMNLGGVGDAKIVNRECAGVGYDGASAAPERPAHEMVRVLAGKIQVLAEAVGAAVDLHPVASLLVELLGLVRVARPDSVGRGEVATLAAGDVPESVSWASLVEHCATLADLVLIVSFSFACTACMKLKL